jgi:hypothetical protein
MKIKKQKMTICILPITKIIIKIKQTSMKTIKNICKNIEKYRILSSTTLEK